MICTPTMGNTTNHLSLCVSQSSRKTRRNRPYVSRPFWPYEHHHDHTEIRLTPKMFHDGIQSRSVHIVKTSSRN